MRTLVKSTSEDMAGPANNRHLFRSPLLRAALVALLCALPSLWLAQAYIDSHKQQKYQALDDSLSAMAIKLQGLMSSALSVGQGLRTQILVTGDISQQELTTYGELYIDGNPYIRHVAVAPDLVIEAVYPLAPNRDILGLDYREVPAQYTAVMRTMAAGETLLAGPVDLVQSDERALIARTPVMQADGRPWGLVALVIHMDKMLADAGITEMTDSYLLALRGLDVSGPTGEQFWGTAQVYQAPHRIEKTIFLPGGSWVLTGALPNASQLPASVVMLPRLMALVLSALLGGVVYLWLRSAQQRHVYLQLLQKRACFDELTGLINRYEFNQRLSSHLLDAQAADEQFAILFIDVDHFKDINDSLGHEVGDLLLQAIGKRVQAYIRPFDLLARLGGDEFVAIINKPDNSEQLVVRVRAMMDSLTQPYPVGNRELTATISIGIALYPNDGADVPTLLQHADRAMYAAKQAGRNTFAFFDMAMREATDRHVALHNEIIQAIKQEQFTVYYQPIMDLSGNVFNRCEALMRWPHPERGMVSPGEFIPVAEQSGAIRDLGRLLSRHVINHMQQLSREGLAVKVSLNRSAQEFNAVEYASEFIDSINQANINPDDITIEITESLLMAGSKLQLETFQKLKEQGFQFAIDDFGTGYSSINYLREYPVDMLKIDKSFVQDLQHSSQARSLVTAFLKIAQALQIDVCAEGVETLGQLEFLRSAGCRYIQGFLLAKPMPFDEFVAFAKQKHTIEELTG